ncbi:MAG: autotransporter-associated beta strand repeat-containing protein, partial [Planctomycetes bacterium]|nr:autotransporter-associated beta strand repeat-containing protein [Planctomycetota bacterium]
MFRFYLRQWLKAFFPRSRRRSRRVVRKVVHPYRPHVEPLEDRWLPAIVTYSASVAVLDFTADNGDADDVMVTAPMANQVVIQVGNGDSITLSGDAATSGDFTLSTTTNTDDTLTINTGSSPAAIFNIFLGDQDDSLSFGLANAPNGVTNVNIQGETGTDTVTLNDLTIGGNLRVGTETLNLNGNVSTDGPVDFSNVNAAVVTASVTVDTEQGDDNAGGDFTLNGSLSADTAGRTLVIVTSTGAAASAGNITLGTFDASGGAQLDSLDLNADSPTQRGDISLPNGANVTTLFQINKAANVTVGADISAGNVTIQNVGTLMLPTGVNLTATTGNLALNAITVDLTGTGGTNTLSAGGAANLTASSIISSGTPSALVINAQQAVTVQDINVSSSVSIQANQDGAGSENFTQNGNITTTDTSANAVNITVDGTGSASLKKISASGGLSVSAASIDLSANITTGGDQTYNNATTLSASATLNAGTGTIGFGDTLATGANDLTLTADEIDFNGGANSVTGSGNLALQPSAANVSIGVGGGAGTLDLSDSDIAALANGFNQITIGRSDGNGTIAVDSASFKDSVTLREPNTGGQISVDGRLDTTAASDGGAITLAGSGGTTTLNADVVTAGADIIISDSIILGTPATVTLDTTDGGNVATGANITLTAPGSVDDDANATALVLNGGTDGIVTLDGAIGADTPIAGLTATGTTINLNGGLVTTTGNQLYNGNATLGADANLTSTANGDISFNQKLDGGFNLTVNTGGGTNFFGAVGSNAALASLTTDVQGLTRLGANVTTEGNQTYGDQLALFANVTLTSTNNGAISFAKVDSNFALTVNTGGNTTFNDAVGSQVALLSLTTDAPGNTSIGADVTTNGDQSYGDNVTLGNNTTLTSANGTISFAGTLTAGANDLTFTSDAINFNGGDNSVSGTGNLTLQPVLDTDAIKVGGNDPVGVLSITATDIAALANGFKQITIGRATGSHNLTVSTNGASFKDALTLRTPGTGGKININGRLDTTASKDPGTIRLHGSGATTTLNADVVTAGADIIISDSIILGTPATVTLDTTDGGNVATGANITLTAPGTVDDDANATALVLQAGTGGTITLDGAIGGTPITALTATGATIDLNGGSVTTAGDQTYNGATVLNTAGNATTLTGSNVTFSSTLRSVTNGEEALTVNANGTTTFNGAVGDNNQTLKSLDTDANGTTALNGGIVDTTGDQSYGDNVTLGANTTLISTDGNVTFTGTVNSDSNATPRSLAITPAPGTGGITFNGAVGDAQALASLTAQGEFNNLNGGSVNTTGDQTYGGVVFLNAAGNATTLTGANVTFIQGVLSPTSGKDALTVNASGATTFSLGVGDSGQALASLTTDAAGTTNLNVSSGVTTTGNQSYGDNVTLGAANTTLTSTGNGAISFDQTLDGASNLTVNTGGNTTFGGAVGNGTPLVSLTTDAGGNTVISGGSIQTTGDQTFNDPVILTADTTLTDSGTGIFFNSTVDGDGNGPWNLTVVTTSGASQIQFNDTVGGANPLAGLTVDDAGPGSATGAIQGNGTTFTKNGNGTFTLAATNTYTGATTVNAGTLFVDGSTAAASDFTVNNATLGGNGTVGGNITVNSGGHVAPGDTVGTLNAGGSVDFGVGSAFDEEITNATTGSFDQLNVTGNVTLASTGASVTLNLTAAGTPAINPGDEFILIKDASVSGSFVAGTGIDAVAAGTTLGEGALLSSNFLGSGQSAFLTYQGGDGNAVAIVIEGPSTFNGTNGDDVLEVRRVTTGGADSIQFLNNGTVVDSRPFASVDSITVNGLDGNDTLTVNYGTSGGFFTQPLTFHGGDPTTSPGDKLVVTGGTFATAIHTFTTTGPNYSGDIVYDVDGNLTTTADQATVSYDGLEPVDMTGSTITDLVFNLPATDDQAVLEDDGTPGNGISQIRSLNATFETTTFSNPTNSLTINLGDGNDALTISGTAAPDDLTAGLTIDGQAGNDTVTFNGALSLSTGAGNLNVTAEAINLNNNVTTNAAQSYNGPVGLGADVTLASTNNGAISFAQTVDGPFALAVNTGGTTTFSGAVGNGTALTSLTTDANGTTDLNGGTVSTSGNQTYNDAVVLTNDTTLNGANVTFNSTVDSDSNATPRSLTVNSPNITFNGAVGGSSPLASLTDNVGTTDLNGSSVTTTGNQTYNGPVVLTADTTLNGSNITFNSIVDSDSNATPRSLTVNSSGNGTTAFAGPVGSIGILASLTTNADGTTDLNAGNVTTTGNQTYNDAVVLTNDTTLNGSNITFGSTLDSDSNATPRVLAVFSSGNGTTTFNGAVGAASPLSFLLTNADGTTDINGNSVSTTGDQMYNDAVVLTANTTLNGANITFNSTVDSDSNATPRALTVNSSNNGTTLFNGTVGGNAALASLTTNADGTTVLVNVGNVTTTGDQTFNDAVLLVGDTTLNGSNITFNSTVDSAGGGSNLTVNSSGNGTTTFNGTVGGNGSLTSLTTNADGTTDLNGGNVTAGFQTFNDAVVLTANTTLTGVDVTFNGTLDSDSNATPRSLTINSFGNTTFNGAVGASSPLLSLTTDANGTTDLNGGTVTTTDNQIYNDAVFLTANNTLNGSNITFNSVVNSDSNTTPRSLTVNSSGNGTTTFNATVGGLAALADLTTNADGTTDLNAGTVTTTGNQTYNDAVVLTANTALVGTNVTFNSTVDSDSNATPRDLTVFSNGTTTFNGTVGGASPLASLTTDAGGTTNLNGGSVNTTGDQSYGDNVTLGANTTLTSTNNGAISFGQTLDGNFTLGVNTGGNTTFGGAVGNGTPLVSLTTDAGGNTVISGGSITTTGDQTFNDPVILTADTTLTDSGTGIFFNSTVDGDGNGPWNLTTVTTNGASQIQFNDTVGGANPLAGLTVDDAGAGSATGAIMGDGTTFTKNGNGTFTLAATNTYTGATTVNAGTLFVDGSTAAASDFTVNNATLGGNGTVGGNITVNSGGHVAPGDLVGTLNAGGSVDFGVGSAFDEQITNATTGSFDQLNVTGNVTLASTGASVTLNL